MSSVGATTTPNTSPPPSTPNNPPTTQAPPPTTSPQPPPTTSPAPPPVTTSVTTAPTAPTSTQIVTSVVTAPPPPQSTSLPPTTVISTISNTADSTSTSRTGQTTGVQSANATNTAAPGTSGLGDAGKTAIAVIIPLAVVALLVVAGIFLWRRRNKRKADEEDRRKEMEAYGYNPNDDPSLPSATKDDDGLVHDGAGYRGWGPAGTAPTVGRKTSTNASSGRHNFSDTSTMYQNPGSPTSGAYNPDAPDQMSHHHRNGTMDSDTVGHGTGAAAAGVATAGLHRGPSNASSTYSAGGRSQTSNDYPIPVHNGGHDYYSDNAYYQTAGPYDHYNGAGGQPIMRESPARRLTQINEANMQHREGGIARNF